MQKKIHRTVNAAIIAALYILMTHMQNFLLPGSASMAIQFRASEALCILAFFTPAAIYGLAVGCMLFNLTSGLALPLDFLLGTMATLMATWVMWKTRRISIKGYPLLSLLMPALTNALLVGYELTIYIGGSYPINAIYVALGELIVMLSLGSVLYFAIRRRKLDHSLFA